MEQDYVVVDLEMTGLRVKQDRILEIGAVRVQEGRIVETMDVLVNPHRALPEKIEELTGLTNDMLEQGEEEPEALAQFLSMSKELPIVGHNIMYDYSFLKQAAVNCDLTYEARGIDTLKLCRKLLPALESKSLEAMCRHYGIVREHSHRALDDAKATNELLVHLYDEFGGNAPELFETKPLQYKIKKQQPVMEKQIRQLEKLARHFNLTLQAKPEQMTRSGASRAIDRIMAEHGVKCLKDIEPGADGGVRK